MDVEPPPSGLPAALHGRFGYSLYSARYGNIYTTRQLLQLAQEALGLFSPAEPVWERDGRFYDSLRPSVEPDGLSSVDEVIAHRQAHLAHVRKMIETMDVFIFTLGLTECWVLRGQGQAFPTVPGSLAGQFDPQKYEFKNFRFSEIREDLLQFRDLVHVAQGNKNLKVLLTVSPVPLTATASDKHVLQATVYSKSVLRAVAGELEAECADIDYFPSFEIVTNPWSRDDFFESKSGCPE